MKEIRQLCIISGKGGTGKTSFAAAFASLADRAVFADCDVDAADLHLILKPTVIKQEEFSGMKIARINMDECIGCGKCYESCRFEAIDEDIQLIEERCEGCGVCKLVCPESAVELVDRRSGWVFTSSTRFGPMAHARLNIAEEASGKLVTAVRNNARALAEEHGRNLIIIDGPPGIGCPVISTMSGVDMVVLVTEPTVAGVHDLERVLGVANHFGIRSVVLVNKSDLNKENTKKIEEYCAERNISVIGKIPYTEVVTKAMLEERTLIEYLSAHSPGDDLATLMTEIWGSIESSLEKT